MYIERRSISTKSVELRYLKSLLLVVEQCPQTKNKIQCLYRVSMTTKTRSGDVVSLVVFVRSVFLINRMVLYIFIQI